MKDEAHETYIRAKQKAQHQVKIVLDQLHTNYRFRQYETVPQESPPLSISFKYLGSSADISHKLCPERKHEYTR